MENYLSNDSLTDLQTIEILILFLRKSHIILNYQIYFECKSHFIKFMNG